MLSRLEGFATALIERLDQAGRGALVADLEAVNMTILDNRELRAVLTDTSIAGTARGLVLADLLAGKVGVDAQRLCVFTATWAPAQEVPRTIEELVFSARVALETGSMPLGPLGLLDARRRVGGYADALLDEIETERFSDIEDELFRWARTVDANDDLRRLLVDRDAPVESRLAVTNQLLEGRVHPATLALARFTVEGGRPRDVVGTLDFLVNYVARARDWRVARVYTARTLDVSSREQIAASLRSVTGKSVELQVAEEPELLGGVLVEIGDLRLDATTRGRLGQLRDAVASGRMLESVLNRND